MPQCHNATCIALMPQWFASWLLSGPPRPLSGANRGAPTQRTLKFRSFDAARPAGGPVPAQEWVTRPWPAALTSQTTRKRSRALHSCQPQCHVRHATCIAHMPQCHVSTVARPSHVANHSQTLTCIALMPQCHNATFVMPRALHTCHNVMSHATMLRSHFGRMGRPPVCHVWRD